MIAGMNERESWFHIHGKGRLEAILLKDDWSIWLHDGDDYFPFLTDLGERHYWPDIMAWKEGEGWCVFEVDGKKGHWSKRDLQKMKLRDDTFQANDIGTVRIKNRDLVGKHKQPTDLILSEISYQRYGKTGSSNG